MSVTQKEIKTLARLSRLEFSDGEIEKFAPEFEEIIEFANKINEQVAGDTGTIREVVTRTVKWEDLREDEVEESLPNEKITSNVQAENGYFPVRRVVK
ncbi:MAG: Asp-tRNA(Asn)/Glu-tRNA(Gln) amidotransferase subunit GatC [Clostridia bacterium]|nr:Asp-tRNA(Asn)/Glu-tRNA(Gln) amidotransferase subunit GatC [Clostridia bacterium]MDE7257188.1 Asp-tRNA(Asn)/Glu-tRNA(Gln) amidotransferase subunit GatC [Clostridia bacterium]